MVEPKTVLLVQADAATGERQRCLLEKTGYCAMRVESIAMARVCLALRMPDIVVMDAALADDAGIAWCREIQRGPAAPVLFLTFSDELPEAASQLCTDSEAFVDLHLDIQSQRAFFGERDLLLTPKEFGLLLCLRGRMGMTVEKDELYRRVWGQSMENDEGAMKTAMSRLRQKLAGSGFLLQASRKNGYCLIRKEWI